jgi:hypothetical protein
MFKTVSPFLAIASKQHSQTAPHFTGMIVTHGDDVVRKNTTLDGGIKTNSGDITLKAVVLKGSIKTNSGDVELKANTQVTGDIITNSGEVSLQTGSVGGNIQTNDGDISLELTSIGGSVLSESGSIGLGEMTVEQNVTTTYGDIDLVKSNIKGTLTFASKKFKVAEGNILNTIHLKMPQEGSSVSGSSFSGVNNNIFVGGNIFNSVISGGNVIIGGRNMGNVMGVGPGSITQVNGFQASATQTETRLTTPDGSIYVNGDKVHGPGEDTYTEFKKNHPKAPTIQGPGWKEEGVKPKTKAESSATGSSTAETEAKKPKVPDQILELKAGSTVTGKVVFESGNGKVIVHPGAIFSNQVEGGIIEEK